MASFDALTEIYDKDNLKKLANITHEDMESIWVSKRDNNIKGEETDIKIQTMRLRKLCRDALKNNCSNKIQYKHSKKYKDCGRLYADSPSLQNIKKEFRGLLSHSTAIDFDAKCCHNTLLQYICKANEIPCLNLTQYINNRNDKMRDFCADDGITLGEAKTLFIKSFNTETVINKLDTKGKPQIKNSFFLKYDDEMKYIQNSLILKFPEEYKTVKRNNTNNLNGKLVARILNIEEAHMLSAAYESINVGYSPMTLAFDGIMIRKHDRTGKSVCENDVINILNESTIKWEIKWDVKDPDLSLDVFADNIRAEENVVFYQFTESELCKDIYNYFYEGKFFSRRSTLYLLVDHKWVCCEKQIKNHVFKTVINCRGYIQKPFNGEMKYNLITQQMTGANSITKVILSLVPENKEFIDEAEKRALGNISFKNGYWNFKLNKFITYEENPEYDTINMIPRDFTYLPPTHFRRQQLDNKIINKMFCLDDDDTSGNDFKAKDNFLHQMARTMCGIITDKVWFNIQGERDSCKGVFDLIMRNSFGEYVGTFNSASFSLDTKPQDTELKQKFLLKNRYARVATSNESAGCWLDGNLIKKVSSGGDMIDARNLYENTETFQNVCKYMWLNNDASRIKPVDSLKTRWAYQMRCCFVDDINNTPNLIGIKYYQKDDDIKGIFCNDDDVKNAFCSLIFDYYNRKDTSFPTELLEKQEDDVNTCPIKEGRRIFKFGGEDDIITNAELKQIFGDNKESFDNLQHMKRIIRQLGGVDYKCNAIRGMRGVCLMGTDEFNEGIEGLEELE